MKYVVVGCGGHGADTPGKRTPYIASLGRQIKEHEFNQPVFDLMAAELRRHGVEVYDMAPGPEDVSLRQRTDKANSIYREYIAKYGKDNVKCVYVSIHFNASDGDFDGEGKDPSGFSVHIQPGTRNKEAGKLAQAILDELKAGTKQINRGIVEQDLHITRETIMPAVLSENGFMDNEQEALLMLDPKFQKEVAIEHAKGILKYFGIPYKEAEKVSSVFKDVPAGHWCEENLHLLKEAKIISGNPDGTFRGDQHVTRYELAAALAALWKEVKKNG